MSISTLAPMVERHVAELIVNKAIKQDWVVINVEPTSADEYVVLVRRNNPTWADKAYSTHKFSTNSNSFYYGDYDMDIDTAYANYLTRRGY